MAGVARREVFHEGLVFGKNIGQRRLQIKPMVTCSKCGASVLPEEAAGGSKVNPKFTICCANGVVTLPPLGVIPRVVELLGGTTRVCVHFRKNIRKYNSVLSFTSMGVNYDKALANGRQGVYTFRICGQVVHKISPFLPAEGAQPKFSQIYIRDPQEQTDLRLATFNELNPDLLQELQAYLEEKNPFCQVYKSIGEREREMGRDAVSELRIVMRAEMKPQGRRRLQYDRPSISEVAVLMPGEEGATGRREIIIKSRNDDRFIRINESHSVCDGLQYATFHPEGENGWAFNTYPKQRPAQQPQQQQQLLPNDQGFDVQQGQDGQDDQHDQHEQIIVDGFNDQEEDGNNDNAHDQEPTSKFLSARQFYAYRLQIRPISEEDPRCYLWMCGRLAHQYVVDQYAKIESERLNFLRKNQRRIRVELYGGLIDAIAADLPAQDVGRQLTVLPSSYIGGPRHMNQLFQDAMSIVRTYGKPDIFITFTCNPKWPEITRDMERHPGQVASDRPDLTVRHFSVRLKDLLQDLTHNSVLGKVVAYTWVIEFQKRGLPHSHILLILADEDKPRTPEDIDRIVSAEIPDPVQHPLAYETVTTSMMHGPCGAANPNCPCMENGVCSKKYPRPFSNETTMNENGYPIYRRRQGGEHGRVFERGNGGNAVQFDNGDVVPHNLWLCTKYNAHINVEICTSVSAVKYLYKYVYKGSDRAEVMVVDGVESDPQDQLNPRVIDEIKRFVQMRYISASESLWRIYGFSLHGHSPNVYRLPVHLEDGQSIYFQQGDDLEELAEGIRDSPLTAWFSLNLNDPAARDFIYFDIPKHYSWDKRGRIWRRRRNPTATIGRMYFVHPKERERFCLRLLLLHVKGATSFQDLRTVPGYDHPFNTYAEAALARELLEDDKEWRQCLDEAVISNTPGQLRHLFAMILVHCSPSKPLELWDRFKHHFSDDFLYRAHMDPAQAHGQEPVQFAINAALFDINEILKSNGSSLDDYPEFPINGDLFFNLYQPLENNNNIVIEAEKQREFEEEAQRNIPKLRPAQREAFDRVTSAIMGSIDQKLFFIDGPGGTGKSFLYNTLIGHIQGQLKMDVIVVASSGIAALILHGGCTAHSTFKIPLSVDSDSTCNISLRQAIATRIRGTHAVFWDEAPMMHRHVFEAVDRTFRDIMKTPDTPFGGKVMVFGGDFRQVLPVIKRASQSQIESACLKKSELWTFVEAIKLTENMRMRAADNHDNSHFADYLLRIGEGREPAVEKDDHEDFVRIPDESVFYPVQGSESPEKQLIRAIYPNIDNTELQPAFLMERAILTPLNIDVNELNALATEMLHSNRRSTYYGQDSIPDPDDVAASHYPPEYLNSLNPPGLAPYRLDLKVGQPVMLIRNLDPKRGLCNGTRLIVRGLGRRLIDAEILLGNYKGNRVLLPRIPFDTTDDGTSPVNFRRRQFPIKPAFALTINKAQGQTLNTVGLYLPQPVFSHGQLYVGLSRCTDSRNLKVLVKDGRIANREGVYTRNIVFRNVFD
jgi:hypothetical protein